jgi:hypothetical protein
MEQNTQTQPQPTNPTGAAPVLAPTAATSGGSRADEEREAAPAKREFIAEPGVERSEQAQPKVSATDGQANKRVREPNEKPDAVGRESLIVTALLAGALGFGVGLLVVSSFSTPRKPVVS